MKDHVIDSFMYNLGSGGMKKILLASKDQASAEAFIKKMLQPGSHMMQVPRGTKIHQYRPNLIVIDDLEDDEKFELGRKLGNRARMKDDPDYYEDDEIQLPDLTNYEQVDNPS